MNSLRSKMPVVDEAFAILKRRLWYFLIPFVAFIYIGAGFVFFFVPTKYVSEGKVGVESQQIPEDFVRSTIATTGGERVGLIQMRVMANAPLIEIIERFDLYKEEWADLPKTALAKKLKKNTKINVMHDPFAVRLGAIAFTVAFEHEKAEVARAVAAELVELFLRENETTRARRAADTRDFLDRQAENLKAQAELIDQKIAEFKQANSHALPEHLELKTDMVARAEADLRAVETETASMRQELQFLKTQGASLSLKSDNGPSTAGMSLPRQIQAVEAELAEQSAKYEDEHWEVKRLAATLEALRARASGQGTSRGAEDSITSGQTLTLADSEYSLSTNRLQVLRDQASSLRKVIERLESEILEIPLVETELRRLTDQYNAYMKEYSEVRANKADAELALSLEEEKKGERFILLEAPVLPDAPTQSLFTLALMVLLCSVGGAAVIAYTAELLDDSINSERMLVSLVGEQPLAVIPNLDSA